MLGSSPAGLPDLSRHCSVCGSFWSSSRHRSVLRALPSPVSPAHSAARNYSFPVARYRGSLFPTSLSFTFLLAGLQDYHVTLPPCLFASCMLFFGAGIYSLSLSPPPLNSAILPVLQSRLLAVLVCAFEPSDREIRIPPPKTGVQFLTVAFGSALPTPRVRRRHPGLSPRSKHRPVDVLCVSVSVCWRIRRKTQ